MHFSLVPMASDLILGLRCVGCARPGTSLCDLCLTDLVRASICAGPLASAGPTAETEWVLAANHYSGLLRQLILAYKERGMVALAGRIAMLLAVTAARVAADDRGVALVPVPASPAARRSRGFDHVAMLVRHMCRLLRGWGIPARRLSLLRHQGGNRDQVGLSASERQRNVGGVFVARRRIRPLRAESPVFLVDDVCTTGATLSAVRRALAEEHIHPTGALVVALA